MLGSPWICRQCLRALVRPLHRQLVRQASTDAQAVLPPALLQRARALAAEHTSLKSSLAADFDPKSAKRLGELSRVAAALHDFEAAQSSLSELNHLLASPDSDAELRQLATDEIASTQEHIATLSSALSASLSPRDPFAHMPCLLEIRPGPGGLEGRYFADAVFRMYKLYCARLGLRTNVVKYDVVDGGDTASTISGTSESPLSEAVLEVLDPGSYGRFKSEAGMHRVQRVPATEKQGRTHTSAVAVWVLPSFPEQEAGEGEEDINDPNSDFYIDPHDVRTEKMRASGAGGQHVNKVESAIRLTHVPSGTVVSMQDSRSQHRNREDAWRLLRARVAQRRREEREEKAWALRNSVLSRDRITRGDKIRTYNYQQNRCTDHRSGIDVFNLADVLDGGERLGELMESARSWGVEREMRALVSEEEEKARMESEANGNGKKGKR